jgi:uncharacterized damage-inducible protein DinB
MERFETLAEAVDWAGRNTAYNLEFIPDDRLDWKPAPTAMSALEIVNHMVFAMTAMLPALSGGDWSEPAFTRATNRAEAQELLRSAAAAYSAALRALLPGDLSRTVHHRMGPVPLSLGAAMPAIDVVHHHGQITYIQTLLGDTETHYYGG